MPFGEASKRCPLGHSFDRARAGYYNLLSPRGGGTHGDNCEMVEARRDFLSRGYYEPLASRIVERALEGLSAGEAILDVGCGEGYYTDFVERALVARDGESRVLAFDISKDAVKHLAKRNRNIISAVASAYAMPVASGSVDLVTLVFSPLALDEIHRVLNTGGRLLMVFPDKRHLFGLKAAIYDTPYENTPEPTDLQGFKLLSDDYLEYEITLESPEAIRSLFMMTPYAYRTSAKCRERVLALSSLTTEVAFRIVVYEKI